MSIGDDLRAAAKATGLSDNELGRRSGIPQAMLSRFLGGKDLRLDTASKLAEYLGLALTPVKKPAKKPRGK